MKIIHFLNIFFLTPLALQAQITLDGTLGTPLELNGPDFQIGAELGQQQGNNLFHSFQDFNLHPHESATFSGPTAIQTVISRVTGGQPSHIDGVLRSTFPHADMYFLNPAGIFFGEQAELDVNGSFHASTAHYLRLGEQGRFDARQPNNSVLTVAPVSAFGFIDEAVSPITLSKTALQVPLGHTLSLISGDLTLKNGSSLKAEQGRINLASVASAGEVQLTATDLDVSSFNLLRNIALTEETTLEVSGDGGGSIFIRGNQFFTNSSHLLAKTQGAQDGGVINIQSQTVSLNQGSRINVDTTAEGQGGHIIITAVGDVTLLSDGTEPLTEVSAGTTSKDIGAGKGGSITINAKNITLKDGAILDIVARGAGHAGRIQLTAQENISLTGTGGSTNNSSKIKAYARMDSNGGNGGDVMLKAQHITMADGSYINTSTFGPGKAGNIILQATGTITLTGAKQEGWGTWVGSGSHARIKGVKAGEGGSIFIEATELHVSDGANIASSSAAAKDMASSQAGDIDIHVAGTVKLSGINPFGETEDGLGSGIYVRSRGVGDNAGNGGTLHLQAGSLIIERGAVISSSTSGEAQGGHIQIDVQGTVHITGDSANIPLREPGEVQLSYQAGFEDYVSKNSISGIYATSTSADNRAGEAGQISLTARDLKATEKGTINTSTQNAGGGGVTLTVDNLLHLHRGEITTSVHGGSGNGGNIRIEGPLFIVLNKGHIKAQADEGRGGDIQITSEQFTASPDSVISASSRLGIDGKVILDSPSENVSSSLIAIPSHLIATDELQPLCGKQQNTNQETSHFVVKHHNNRSASPHDLQSSP